MKNTRVFKFGGASVKDAESIKNVGDIINMFADSNLVVIISAMGKTTNALEGIAKDFYYNKKQHAELIPPIKQFHNELLDELFSSKSHPIYDIVNNLFVEIEWVLDDNQPKDYSFIYDQIVSVGELLSTRIVSAYLNDAGINNNWLDVRDCIRTDSSYREAKIDWEFTCDCINKKIPELFNDKRIILTQGFIGSTDENNTTTLGREGSDFTASIFAHCLETKQATIWKDVPGFMNADPRFFNNAEKLEQISFHDAIELAFYGAKVVHPKTIKPLQNKNIPLYVRSFKEPKAEGTVINSESREEEKTPSYILKTNQVLVSLSTRDLSFVAEDNMSLIFGLYAKHKVKMNLMQNSAISFSACSDNDPFKIPGLLEDLKNEFDVLYNENLKLMTVRYYDSKSLDKIIKDKDILIEQRSRHTIQMVFEEIEA
ncbi:MAG: aspartate kinase [Bacteroidia bacterium]|nr:aspartate kinase [Bacteroidia bacterium]NNM15953.1 aspartate kinase [Bacteroidia bacterium]